MSRQPLTKAVEAYLEVVILHPEKPPRTQRAQRDDEMMILGFNRAQEALRSILEQTGHKALAQTRAEGQRQPMKLGDRNLWVAAWHP